MSDTPSIKFAAVVLGAPDARALGEFYRRLLGWPVTSDQPGWFQVREPGGGVALSFQDEPHHVPPVWPPERGAQQMMLHLDLRVDDLEAAGAHAQACGATLAAHQPQDDVRVYLDPAGHPFCLFLPGS